MSLDHLRLNEECFCVALDSVALDAALTEAMGGPEMAAMVSQRCPHAFSANPVFISASHARRMASLVGAVESVAALPAYQEAVLAGAPAIAHKRQGQVRGVFFGYDFHVGPEGISLIEINTNAGGAMLNAVLARAHRACCQPVNEVLKRPGGEELEQAFVDMFVREWQLAGRQGRPSTIAIVDADPEAQYLYPEFLLFQRLFQRHGIQALICDPRQLEWKDGGLWFEGAAVDLVYNRLTDFMLEQPASAALRDAYLADAVVLTPHPRAHAIYANKKNLCLLSDPERLAGLGVPEDTIRILTASVPRTEVVDAANADRLWEGRRLLFFKPLAGFGGKAAYRGDKLTRRVWGEILAGGYVAQALVAPPERATSQAEAGARLKFDVRAYAYEGKVQLLSARLYSGQTTNFRTKGGGFAPVYPVDL
jgi:hypothetical protein